MVTTKVIRYEHFFLNSFYDIGFFLGKVEVSGYFPAPLIIGQLRCCPNSNRCHSCNIARAWTHFYILPVI